MHFIYLISKNCNFDFLKWRGLQCYFSVCLKGMYRTKNKNMSFSRCINDSPLSRYHKMFISMSWPFSYMQLKAILYNVQFLYLLIVFSFWYLGLDFLWATRWVCLERQRMLTLSMHLVNASSFIYLLIFFYGVRVAHFFCYLVCIILVILCSLLCVFLFYVLSLFLDCIIIIESWFSWLVFHKQSSCIQ